MDPFVTLVAPEGLPIGLVKLARRTFDAVLFDMDGTLVDSRPSVARTWSRWADEVGLDPQRLVGMQGIPVPSIIERVLEDRDATARASALARINALELGDVEGIAAMPGAKEALAALAGEMPRSAIATSSSLELATARIASAGLVAPDVVVCADEVERGKPDPAPYALAARRVGADPTRCLVVEDAPAGLASGRAAGCATLAVATTHTIEALQEAGPDAVVRDLAGVRLVVTTNGVRVEEMQARSARVGA